MSTLCDGAVGGGEPEIAVAMLPAGKADRGEENGFPIRTE